MSTNTPIKQLVAVVIQSLCLVAALDTTASDDLPPPRPEQLRGTWIGFDEDSLRFCRLELQGRNQGLCCTSYTENPPALYRVQEWLLEGFKIEVRLKSIDKNAEPIVLKGEATPGVMHLEIAGTDIPWSRKITLRREADFMDRNKKAKQRIEKERKYWNRKAAN